MKHLNIQIKAIVTKFIVFQSNFKLCGQQFFSSVHKLLTHSKNMTGGRNNCHHCVILKEWLVFMFFGYIFCVLLSIAKSRPWLERTLENHFDLVSCNACEV